MRLISAGSQVQLLPRPPSENEDLEEGKSGDRELEKKEANNDRFELVTEETPETNFRPGPQGPLVL